MPPIPNMPAPFDAVWRRACQPSYLSQPHSHWLSAWYRKKTKITKFPWHYFNYIHSYLFFLGARTNYPASASSDFKLLHHHWPPRQCLPSKLKHQPTQEVQLLAMLWRIVCGGHSCSSAVVPLVDSCFVLVLSWIISGVLSHGQIL